MEVDRLRVPLSIYKQNRRCNCCENNLKPRLDSSEHRHAVNSDQHRVWHFFEASRNPYSQFFEFIEHPERRAGPAVYPMFPVCTDKMINQKIYTRFIDMQFQSIASGDGCSACGLLHHIVNVSTHFYILDSHYRVYLIGKDLALKNHLYGVFYSAFHCRRNMCAW